MRIYNKRFEIKEKEKMSRQNCECAYVLNTEEGLLRCVQMSSTEVCYVLFRWDMARGGGGGGTVLVSGCFGAQCSVVPARGQQFKERVGWVWGIQSDFPNRILQEFLQICAA